MNELTKSTPYSHFKIGSPVLLKENATAKRRNVQEDWPEKRRVPVERSFAQILGVSFGLLLTFDGFPETTDSTLLFLKKSAAGSSLLWGTISSTRNCNVFTPELILNQYSKVILNPIPNLKFLEVLVDSHEMTPSIPTEKMEKLKTRCKEAIPKPLVRTPGKLTGQISSTAVAVLPPHFYITHYIKIQGILWKISFDRN